MYMVGNINTCVYIRFITFRWHRCIEFKSWVKVEVSGYRDAHRTYWFYFGHLAAVVQYIFLYQDISFYNQVYVKYIMSALSPSTTHNVLRIEIELNSAVIYSNFKYRLNMKFGFFTHNMIILKWVDDNFFSMHTYIHIIIYMRLSTQILGYHIYLWMEMDQSERQACAR